ncbi:MAG: precorrin-4 C(11)-methyltransferase [Lachnospiraceae bacterium]|nr:precorrin-4 C(11)-methyltransferase [Lachnospiraceae bacterium]
MIHFVGAGPGAPDLITLRGEKLLKEADLIIYAGSLVNPKLLQVCKEDAKILDSAKMNLDQVIEAMFRAEKKGLNTVRLHTGDPSLYGAIREQMDLLSKEGIAYDITPGVSSFQGAAAALSAEYTLPDISQSLIISRLEGRTGVPENEKLSALASHGSSMAIFLSASDLEGLKEELLKGGTYTEDTPAAIAYKVSWKDEKIIKTTIKDLPEAGRSEGIKKTALILVGDFLKEAPNYQKSKLYDKDFTTGYRAGRKKGISIISFTKKGFELAFRLKNALSGASAPLEVYEESLSEEAKPSLSRKEWINDRFYKREALIFIGATGIAVRMIADLMQSKTTDPAVLVMDEEGRNMIPLISGHLGGANELALKLSELLGANPVITTATDLKGSFAVDLFAKENELKIINPEKIKHVSSKVLEGDSIEIYTDTDLKLKGLPEEGVSLIRGALKEKEVKASSVIISIYKSDLDALKLCPFTAYLGIGCKKGTDKAVIEEVYRDFISEKAIYPNCIRGLASIDLKKEERGILDFAKDHDLPFVTFTRDELMALEGDFTFSQRVLDLTGVDNVCERSAAAYAKKQGFSSEIEIKKYKKNGVTLALALIKEEEVSKKGKLYIIGRGPGSEEDMTFRARKALEASDLICGYSKYLKDLKLIFPHKDFYETGMGRELERCRYALKSAFEDKRRVAMVCSGDAGIYGMSGPILWEAKKYKVSDIEMIPGISASLSGAALLGAPLMNDFVTISLSDIMTPPELIEKRLRAAGMGDLVTVIYNPMSSKRRDHLKKACDILLEYRPEDTVSAYVRNIGREGESYKLLTLFELREADLDMFTTVFIGNKDTRIIDGKMVTLRGYEEKEG